MPDLTFRPYESSDREACRAIFKSHLGTYFAPGEKEEFDEFLSSLGAICPDDDLHYWVGCIDGRPVMCGGAFIREDCASLIWGILQSGLLGKGLGKSLLLHRINWIKENRPAVRSIFGNTAPLTEGFFAKHGFIPYHREPNYWGGELELVAMELSLDGQFRGPDRKKQSW